MDVQEIRYRLSELFESGLSSNERAWENLLTQQNSLISLQQSIQQASNTSLKQIEHNEEAAINLINKYFRE
jgi:hypothetical protein